MSLIKLFRDLFGLGKNKDERPPKPSVKTESDRARAKITSEPTPPRKERIPLAKGRPGIPGAPDRPKNYNPPARPAATPRGASPVITPEFQRALDRLENSSENLFITGRAGTGKSTLLELFQSRMSKHCVVLAPTGAAALNVGGSTIHSFFEFPPRLLRPGDEEIKFLARKGELFAKTRTLIIDEISMVSADLLDAIDASLRLNRGKDEPFGGVRIVLFGDPYQLPPVVVGRDLEEYYNNTYGGPFFFNGRSFNGGRFGLIELTRCFRQTEGEFLRLLNSVREGTYTESDLEALNSRASAPSAAPGLTMGVCATNKAAEEINKSKLAELPSESFYYRAKISGDFDQRARPTESTLELKKGAQIMTLKNDPDGRWVNGSIGRIADLDEKGMTIQINGAVWELYPDTWEAIEYEYDREKNKIAPRVAGTFTQYPVKLAWAITIHKSQGQTFENIRVDLGRCAFAHGQTYVALSRCRTFAGLTLARPIKPADIRIDRRADAFAKRLRNGIKY